ncbi:MAG: hypothetical protein A3I77_00200 [Gammaproteobacteria bacterium RIFCSPLOWO2_02_FULL_42_14]|nr:MAG: hypothetical protein A3B71_04305 [Gammaproteobacteria bacterium RIFCSPHIGHO2_02_FULL_42_43]OGT29369.1 MAG: hypothetical protein A2624_02295 [Gammaproteobacteria bacterium RIFCSPHIGHO2_01_FULL_42_8]OGT50892.1 MAG: hypothetical protein A3E54_03925 [Gammaproteobacteria bacterium RIFCSPHIGHO2_12_FULL_41_25]OGT62828.1 MAG: hypothetical protein A3I77_00200 [Gammaproteobacteria bacterium RIFCSPLOWO2_02_FULL_42_14]OGT86786.1 MAG: hypothetical protein A3G86_03085 [Gammaproteobacteria bacterium R
MNQSVSIGIIFNEQNQVLIALRPPHVVSPGIWEFPGGKVEKNETTLQAVVRELNEEIGIDAHNPEFFLKTTHTVGEKQFTLYVYTITQFSGTPRGRENQEIRWVALDQLHAYNFLPANRAVITQLTAR